jgi:hypothetical protein
VSRSFSLAAFCSSRGLGDVGRLPPCQWLRLSATNPPARTLRATDRALRFRDRALRPDRAPGPELVPSLAAVLAPPPSTLVGRFRRPTNCATDKQYCGRCSGSGSLAILAAIRRASSGQAAHCHPAAGLILEINRCRPAFVSFFVSPGGLKLFNHLRQGLFHSL